MQARRGEIPMSDLMAEVSRPVQDALAATCVADCLWHAYLPGVISQACVREATR